MTVDVSMLDGALTFDLGEEQEAVEPQYRGGLQWAFGNVQLTFLRHGGRVAELRFDTGGGHYVLRRVGG